MVKREIFTINVNISQRYIYLFQKLNPCALLVVPFFQEQSDLLLTYAQKISLRYCRLPGGRHITYGIAHVPSFVIVIHSFSRGRRCVVHVKSPEFTTHLSGVAPGPYRHLLWEGGGRTRRMVRFQGCINS